LETASGTCGERQVDRGLEGKGEGGLRQAGEEGTGSGRNLEKHYATLHHNLQSKKHKETEPTKIGWEPG